MISTTNAFSDGSTDVNFNAWAYWMFQKFTAFGWTQTADTGQGTFPVVGSPPTVPGYYAIFVSTDSLSGICPIYVKMEWWAASNVPAFAITMGTGGTDGAGNLLAPFTVRQFGGGNPLSLQAGSANTSNLIPLYASGDSGSIRFAIFLGNDTSPSPDYNQLVYMFIARSRNSSGVATDSYVQLWAGHSSNNAFQTVFAPTVGTTNNLDSASGGNIIAPFQNSAAANSWSGGGAVMVSPVMQNIGGLSNPTPDLLLGSYADFKASTSASISVYGTFHNYIAVSAINDGWRHTPGAPNTSLLMRYE